MRTPIVSVIVPVYNDEKYIRDCLQSLLSQTLQNFELIVVDDASTDRSGEICAAMAETDSRIRIVQLQENSGAGMARNRGMEAAAGRFLTFVDGDDIVETEYLKTLYAQAILHNADVVSGGSQEYHLQKDGSYLLYDLVRVTDSVWIMPENVLLRIEAMLENRTNIASWGKLYQRDFIEKYQLHFDDMPNFEDCLFNFLCLYYAKRYVFISATDYHYHVRAQSLSRGQDLSKIKQYLLSGIKTLLACEQWMAGMELFQQYPELKIRLKAYFFGIFLKRHMLPVSKFYSLEQINQEIAPYCREYFHEQQDFVMLLLDYCVMQQDRLEDDGE